MKKRRKIVEKEGIPMSISQASKVAAIGAELGMSVVVMAFVGFLLFKELFGEDFAVMGVVIGVVLGFFVGVYTIYRSYSRWWLS